jgi:hypothetical protein
VNGPVETIIREWGPKPHKPTIIEGLPGLGSVGRLAISLLIDQRKARKIAELYSPHFPYQAIVDSRGLVRLPRSEFYHSVEKRKDLVLISGDCQPQSNYGQYDVASKIIQYAVKHSASPIISLGGFASPEKEKNLVVTVATKSRLLSDMITAGASVEKTGIPIVGVAGLLVALAKTAGLDAICVLGKTTGLGPDPNAARRVLEILAKALDLKLDLAELEKQMMKLRDIENKVGKIEKKLTRALRKDQTRYIG